MAASMARVVERPADVLEGQPELAADQDLLQTQQIIGVVEPVAGGRAEARVQQADRVVVMKRPDRQAAELGDFLDLIVA
jgi:hypothetical protein